LSNVTVSNNANGWGVVIGVSNGGHIDIKNSVIYNESDPGIVLGENIAATASIQYSNILGGENSIITNFGQGGNFDWGDGNIDEDPLFCDPENMNFSLAENSPAVGAGENGTDIGALGVGCEAIELAIDQNLIPSAYSLHQNYPNPFNPTTQIRYDLPEASVVSLSIYDLMGREIITMINSEQTAGFKNVQWNATNNLGKSVPAGMYIYTIQAGEFRQTRKMVLLK